MNTSLLRAAACAAALAIAAMTSPAAASTDIAWAGSTDFDIETVFFGPVTANQLSFLGEDTSYGEEVGPLAHSHGQEMDWWIDLEVDGAFTRIFTQHVAGNCCFIDVSYGLVNLSPFSFSGGAVTGITMGCDNCSSNTYHQWSNVTLRFDDVPTGVPEPASWALMIAGFGLAGAGLRRRKAVAVRA